MRGGRLSRGLAVEAQGFIRRRIEELAIGADESLDEDRSGKLRERV